MTDINNGLWGCNKPIVITYGQTGSGKTTALVRLIKHLQANEFSYGLCETFHRHYYPNVKIEQIENFFSQQMTRSINKIDGNADAFLCNIKSENEGVVCRFLESPGENLFALREAAEQDVYRDGGIVIENEFQYFLDIINTRQYKKIWVFLMDPGFTNDLLREKPAYIARIKTIAKTLGENDNVIFLVNKDDLVKKHYGPIVKEYGYKGYINKLYDNILDMAPFTTETVRWWWPFSKKAVEHYRIVPFCSYDVDRKGKNTDGGQMAAEFPLSDPSFPKKLWDTINDAIMNRF